MSKLALPCAVFAALVLIAWIPAAQAAGQTDVAAEASEPGKEPIPEGLRRLKPGQSPADLDEESLQYLLGLHHQEEEQVRMVLLPVSVTTRRGRLVRNMDSDDFLVLEDRIPQSIEYFSADTAHSINVAFLLDVSSSMRLNGKLAAAKEAIRYFVESLGPHDRFGLICFADEQVAWVTEFTSDRERFLKRLAVQEGFGRTAINDAVAAAPGLVDEQLRGKKAIVLLTDGVDNASSISPWRALRLARQVNVPIYALGYSNIPRGARIEGSTPSNLRVLGTFTSETGGLLFAIHDPDDLKEAAAAVLEELRFQYLIGYYPSRGRWDGRFRHVRLETKRDGLHVRTRNGYYATP